MNYALSEYFNMPSLFDASKAFFKEELNLTINSRSNKALSPQEVLKDQIAILTKFEVFKNLVDTPCVYILGGVSDKNFYQQEDTDLDYENIAQALEQAKYKMLVLWAIDIPNVQQFRKAEIAALVRAFNRVYKGAPAVVLLRYNKNNETNTYQHIALATCERVAYERKHLKQTGHEKIAKVSFIQGVRIADPHRAHLDILEELCRPATVQNFDTLYQHWLGKFNTRELNKRFYSELFSWYEQSKTVVQYPVLPDNSHTSNEYKSISVIRMLTRLIFIWFIKEKGLVEEKLFKTDELATILKNFDPHDSLQGNYYNAILQNLFFATLNTEMNGTSSEPSRYFAKVGGISNDYLDTQAYRYPELFADSAPEAILKKFENIPFLNGGLFECLDTKVDAKGKKGEEYRYDGFSSKPQKRAFIPNTVFFGNAPRTEMTLFGESKKKRKDSLQRQQGLIDIFGSYKFTVEENTPLEEEIALDPELLGKIFENLLASVNEDTQTTARKATGSFYTPREIVQYMVDESLKEYLLTALAPADKTADSEVRQHLERLFTEGINENPFATEETQTLITAISQCKILDPACGSGAFPMGVLQRMVLLLSKLDPNNKGWKETLLRNAQKDKAFIDDSILDEKIRGEALASADQRIEYIKDSFNSNQHELDFQRKLFLIQSCIYGVDIQQIAIQIAKLRFFISLVIEQKLDNDKPNRGIPALPNLETNFVAANTLLGLSTQSLIQSDAIIDTQEKLHTAYKRIFYVRKWQDKKELRKKIEILREQLRQQYFSITQNQDLADKVASWNPFDQIHSSSFFDAEQMFNIKNGFDIVIGNPPYVSQKGIEDNPNIGYDDRILYRQSYEILQNIKASGGTKINLFGLFVEKGLKLLKKAGEVSIIVHKNILKVASYKNLRRLILEKYSIIEIIDMMSGAFLNITAETIIIRISARKNINSLKAKFFDASKSMENFDYKILKQSPFLANQDFIINIYEVNFLKEIQKMGNYNKLSEVAEIASFGLDTNDNKKYFVEQKLNKDYKPAVMGRHIAKWKEKSFGYVYYHESVLTRAGKPSVFEVDEKIIMQRISGNLIAAYDSNKLYCFNSTNIIYAPKKGYYIKYLLAILNSKFLNFFYCKTYSLDSKVTVNVTLSNLSGLPIFNATQQQQTSIETLVDYILYLKAATAQVHEYVTNDHLARKLEEVIDGCVYELYFSETMTAKGLGILDLVAEQCPSISHKTDDETQLILNQVYSILIASEGAIRNRLIRQKMEVEEIKIINGSAL
jgi:adenine-specific DNA-methyltransferase